MTSWSPSARSSFRYSRRAPQRYFFTTNVIGKQRPDAIPADAGRLESHWGHPLCGGDQADLVCARFPMAAGN